MAEWLVEHGIGEDRAILVDNGEVRAARLDWHEGLRAGAVGDAVLISRRAGHSRGVVRFASGEEALIDALPVSASEGAPVRAEVTRAAMAETGRFKRAQARWCEKARREAPRLDEALAQGGLPVRLVGRFPDDPWGEIMADALGGGEIAFAGGSLTITPTPAMTLIDIDGTLPAAALSRAAVPVLALALRRLDIAGSIGIDFPTIERKDERRMVNEALDTALDDWPHERTAMNGFGFVQIVARLERPSILHRARFAPAASAARLLLRRAEDVREPGVLLLGCHPAVRTAMRESWEAELVRRTGRSIRWHEDIGLALAGGFAQAVAP